MRSVHYIFETVSKQEGDPRNFYDGRSIEIRLKFVLRRKISTKDNLLREKVSQGVLYYGLESYTTGQL